MSQRIQISKNTVVIKWRCYFEGAKFTRSGWDFKKTMKAGIKCNWNGFYKVKGISNVRVRVLIMESKKGSRVGMYAFAGISSVVAIPMWSRKNPGTMSMFDGDRRASTRQNHKETLGDFKITAAHEFGHILGIKDGYNGYMTKYINSIMCDPYAERNGSKRASEKDIEKALEAYRTNKMQVWYN